MFGFRITRDKEIIEAIKTVEELKKVYTVLRIDVATKKGVDELCKDYALSGVEGRHYGIGRGSYLSSILSLYKIKYYD